MERELTIERRGEHYHLRFHKYMGPWEGHQIEKVLDLEEVAPPPDGERYEEVLRPNQAYLWHEMSFDPELHALVTADRLENLAVFVRDRDVVVLEGSEFLPPAPERAHVHYEAKDDTPEGSYVAHLEKRHASVWEQGPRAVIGAVLLRVIPAALLVFVIVVAGRHYGDKYSDVSVDQMFARANRAVVQQSAMEQLITPDFSHLVRNEIRSITFAHGNRMLLGDGNLLAFEGAGDVMPWLTQASMSRAPIVIDATARDGEVRASKVVCGGQVLARDVVVQRVAKLPPGDSTPLRAASPQEGMYRIVATLPVQRDADALLEEYAGDRLSLTGVLRQEGERLVLRLPDGSGVVLTIKTTGPKMRAFLEVFVDDPAAVVVDVELDRVYPWLDARDPQRQRESTSLAGEAELHSASAQNYHVHGRV